MVIGGVGGRTPFRTPLDPIRPAILKMDAYQCHFLFRFAPFPLLQRFSETLKIKGAV